MNKNIIVTGGLGFIGSNLIDLLIDKKYSVINLDKISYSSNFYNTKEFAKNKNSQIKGFKKFIKSWDGKKNLIFVTHYVFISEILDYAPSSGEIIISDKDLKVIDTIEIEY